ncbi:MAG: GNAT family N-acetyltransferase [Candidatus Protochlamydia sp.]|nr:GNAT family N-acetyltransferase [Candidatus Protochlamydia sp.]
MEFNIKRFSVPSTEFAAYQEFLSPQVLTRLQATTPEEEYWIAVEAITEQQLVGLALAQYYFINQTAQLFVWTVKEEYRHQGIGSILLDYLETNLKEHERISGLGLEYEKNCPSAAAVEKILAKRQWPVPYVYLIRCHFDAYQFDPQWIHTPLIIPPDMELFSWEYLAEEDRTRLAFMADQGQFLPYLSPSRDEELIHLPSSLGLRYKGKIIGWNITHLIDPDTLRFSILYLDKSYQFTGLGVQLGIQSILLQKKLPIPRTVLEVNLKAIDLTWRYFVKKKLMPYADKIERMKCIINYYTY